MAARALARHLLRVAVSAGGALSAGLLAYGLQVAVSPEGSRHGQFIVAAGLACPLGAILATAAMAVRPRTDYQLVGALLGSLSGAVVGVIVGRAALNRLGGYGLIVYPLAIGFLAYTGYLAGQGAGSGAEHAVREWMRFLRRQPPDR
jgi:hypothetical protein